MKEEDEINIFDILYQFENFIRLKKYVILLILVVVMGAGILHHSQRKTVFFHSISVTSNSLPFDVIKKIHSPIEAAINSRSTDSLPAWLNLPAEQVDFILNCSSQEISSVGNTSFQLLYSAHSLENLKNLDTAIINYLNRTPFVQRSTTLRKQELTASLMIVRQQIERLDSIQKMIPNVLRSGKEIQHDYNLGTIYQQMANLKITEQELSESLAFADEFSKLSSFISAQKGSLVKNLVVSLFISLIVVLVYFAYFIVVQKLRKRKSKTHQH